MYRLHFTFFENDAGKFVITALKKKGTKAALHSSMHSLTDISHIETVLEGVIKITLVHVGNNPAAEMAITINTLEDGDESESIIAGLAFGIKGARPSSELMERAQRYIDLHFAGSAT